MIIFILISGSLNAASGGARSLQGTFNPSSNFQRSRNSRNSFSNNPRSFNPSRQNVPSMPFFSNPTTQSPNFPEPDSATLPPPPNPVTVEAPSVQSFPQSPASVSNASSSANGRNENKGEWLLRHFVMKSQLPLRRYSGVGIP